jgi:hypothetical protein
MKENIRVDTWAAEEMGVLDKNLKDGLHTVWNLYDYVKVTKDTDK